MGMLDIRRVLWRD